MEVQGRRPLHSRLCIFHALKSTQQAQPLIRKLRGIIFTERKCPAGTRMRDPQNDLSFSFLRVCIKVFSVGGTSV
jgi:hypothetical protein